MSIKTIDFNTNFDAPIAIALGFFDCIHIGHAKLVCAVNRYAQSHNNVQSALFTFSNDPNEFFGKEKEIYTFNDRKTVLNNLGLDVVIKAKFDKSFMEMLPCDFLENLSKFNVKAIVVGADYTFGKGASGNVDFLRAFCIEKNIDLIVVPFETVNGAKLSTRNLKALVKIGDVATLNMLLSEPYFMEGTVLHAKHNGTGLGFPTANISIERNRLPLCNGIYATYTYIDGKKHQSMTNVGSKPTFDDETTSVETFVFDFSENLYGKYIRIEFIERTRDVQKFATKEDLHNQLAKDEMQIREILKDGREK